MLPARVRALADGMEMVLVPAGSFWMGTHQAVIDTLVRQHGGTRDKYEREVPRHQVTLEAFYIALHPVTQAQYATFVAATGHRAPTLDDPLVAEYCWQGNEPPPEKAAHPVVLVDWDDASAYCAWAGTRLPTEAEWEKMARGADGRTFPWGDEWDPARGAFGGTGTSPIGLYPAGSSPYGALDVVGNVWEWVGDWFDPDYYRHSPAANPPGPPTGAYHVTRGGSWRDGLAGNNRVTYRTWLDPAHVNHANIGFRPALSASVWSKHATLLGE